MNILSNPITIRDGDEEREYTIGENLELFFYGVADPDFYAIRQCILINRSTNDEGYSFFQQYNRSFMRLEF